MNSEIDTIEEKLDKIHEKIKSIQEKSMSMNANTGHKIRTINKKIKEHDDRLFDVEHTVSKIQLRAITKNKDMSIIERLLWLTFTAGVLTYIGFFK
jgi:predicted  nucleic acid-binding Zn-ribbon protein